MNANKDENLILNIIKFGPILFVLVMAFITTQIILNDKKETFERDIQLIKNAYIENNKEKIREEIDQVYNIIKNEKEKSENLLKKQIKERVYEAHQIASNIYKEEVGGSHGHEHSREHIFETIKHALGGIIYNNGRGYIFMDDVNGVKLLQPLNKEFEGKNLLEFEDAKGYKFVKKIVQTIKDKSESYDTYHWYKSKDNPTPYKKMSFYKYFEPFNLAIGTGEYLDDFENELKQRVIQRIREIKFGDAGYIFAYTLDGTTLSHHKKELIGKNRINYKDKNGKLVVKEVIDFAKENKNGGYISYSATINPVEGFDNTSKVSYVKVFEDWGWLIGTGFYMDKLNNVISQKEQKLKESNEKSVKDIVTVSIGLTVLFILFSFFISKYIESIFKEYKKNLNKQMNKTIEKEKLLIQQSKMATMGEMIGNIAHQWKQPLSLISMSNGLIKLNKEDEDISSKEELDYAITKIDDSVKYLSTTIDDFRNFFSPDKQKAYFKIEKIIDKTCNLIESQFRSNNIQVIKNIDNVEVYGYQNELLQVLINILKNAKDELIKIDNEKLLFIKIYKDNEKVLVEIKDSAGGIPEEIINKVFNAYFTTKQSDGGTGIGLYMSKQIIEGMDGEIEVINEDYQYENVEYTGAKFIITLPTIMPSDN